MRSKTPEQRKKDVAKSQRWRLAHPEASREAAKRWRLAHPDAVRRHDRKRRAKDPAAYAAKQRKGHLRRAYALSAEAYQAMLNTRAGSCAICGGRPGTRALCVDHCHRTGMVRGLLCDLCNFTLGYARDSQDILLAASAYLKRHATPAAASAI